MSASRQALGLLSWLLLAFAAARSALLLFIAQLDVNALWTWLFFVWREGALAFGEIVLLWLLIAATFGLFWRVNKLAAILLVPYLGWLSFASALSYAMWRLNPGLLG